jgi:hypothetical protein
MKPDFFPLSGYALEGYVTLPAGHELSQFGPIAAGLPLSILDSPETRAEHSECNVTLEAALGLPADCLCSIPNLPSEDPSPSVPSEGPRFSKERLQLLKDLHSI